MKTKAVSDALWKITEVSAVQYSIKKFQVSKFSLAKHDSIKYLQRDKNVDSIVFKFKNPRLSKYRHYFLQNKAASILSRIVY